MPVVRYFAQARDAAGTASERLPGATVGEVCNMWRRVYGEYKEQVVV